MHPMPDIDTLIMHVNMPWVHFSHSMRRTARKVAAAASVYRYPAATRIGAHLAHLCPSVMVSRYMEHLIATDYGKRVPTLLPIPG